MPPGEVDVAGAVELALDLAGRAHRGEPEPTVAEALSRWLSKRSLPARVQRVGEFGANVLVGTAARPDLAFYGHIDTSLRLSPWEDTLLFSNAEPPAPPWCDGEIVWGAGIGVALAPTAGALVAAEHVSRVAGTDRVAAMVVSGGTHRAQPPWPLPRRERTHTRMGAGVHEALESGFLPRAVISAKGGAPAPLWEEPGSLYLEVTIRDDFGPALARPPGKHLVGSPAAVANTVRSIGRWREQHMSRRRDRDGQAGADVVLGALSAGAPSKPDMLPDCSRLYLYVVTVPGDEEESICLSLAEHLLSDAELAGHSTEVRSYGSLPPGATDPSHPVVECVTAAWKKRLPVPSLTGWRGSTDGSLLRSRGIPTVRAGPELLRHPDDARIEGVRLADLDVFCGLWAEAALEYLGR